jgi:phage terminase large subunit-like protein
MEELKPALWTRKWWLIIAQNKFNDNAVTTLLENDEEIKTIVHHVKIVDQHGNSSWPENPDFSKSAISDLEKSEGAGYIRERMQVPFEEGTTFKAEWLNEWVDCKEQKYDGVLIHYLDPSYKSTDKSDFKAWILLGKKGRYYDIIKPWIRKATSKTMWEHAYDIDDEFEKFTIKHAMEANFIQDEVHGKELDRVAEDRSRQLRCMFDYRDKGNKFERIETLAPLFQRGLIRFNIHEKESPDMKLLRTQLLATEKGSRINDDGPDALEGAVWMADKYTKPNKPPRSSKYKKKNFRAI